MTFDRLTQFLEHFGIATMVACWFMFRMERRMDRQDAKLNTLIVTTTVVSTTLGLDAQQSKLIAALGEKER